MRYRIIAGVFIAFFLFAIWFVASADKGSPETKTAPTVSRSHQYDMPDRTKHVSRNIERKPAFSCKNGLARTLYKAGFRGENLREAWAIAMRESHGQERNVTNSDYGLFQFNYPTWGNRLDYNQILDGDYNAQQAYRISNGGKTWAHWGLTGSGETDPSLYGMWSDDQVWAWITEPFQRYYKQYPC